MSIEVVQQEKLPARKVYTITEGGRAELRARLLSEPELPMLRSLARTQLAWADCLSGTELDGLLASYERLLADQVLMRREMARRGCPEPARSPRERLLWKSIEENDIAFYERELAWARALRASVAALAE